MACSCYIILQSCCLLNQNWLLTKIGKQSVSVDDMRANTEYSGYSAASPVIQWFWEVVQGFSKEDKARLLQFVTGTSKVKTNAMLTSWVHNFCPK